MGCEVTRTVEGGTVGNPIGIDVGARDWVEIAVGEFVG